MQVVFVPVSHETCEEEVFAESLTMLSTLTSEILGIFLDVLDHHSVGSVFRDQLDLSVNPSRCSQPSSPLSWSLVSHLMRTQLGLRLAMTL